MAELGESEQLRVAKEGILEALDAQMQQSEFDITTRESLLGTFALLHSGRKLDIERMDMRSWNGQGPLPASQRIDRLEYFSGYPPRRHNWVHGLERFSGSGAFVALIQRMHELQATEQRDLELEQATIEMGSLSLMRPDEHGNMFLQGIQVRSLEVYKAKEGEPSLDPRAVGFSLQWGRFHYGEGAGFTGDNARRWFVAGSGYYAPLDAITEFPAHWNDRGALVGTEYAPRPLAIA